jgi:hypothetical protein
MFNFPANRRYSHISDRVIQYEKMTVNLYMSPNCMKIGHGSD